MPVNILAAEIRTKINGRLLSSIIEYPQLPTVLDLFVSFPISALLGKHHTAWLHVQGFRYVIYMMQAFGLLNQSV